MKKIISFILSSIIMLSSFNMSIFQAFASDLLLTEVYGWYESIHIEWSGDANAANAAVYYKPYGTSTYTAIDSELIRADGTNGVADIVGITKGIYDIKVETSDGNTLTQNNISVGEFDRSGYAHFNYSQGVGAYNDDGTPKSDAQIIYVTNSNKNSVTLGKYTGIGNILKNASKYSYPIIVRIIGTVDTQTRDSDGTKTTDKNNGVVSINGLTDTEKTNDSYFNMLDISGAKNITVEGIGKDATIEKWGFTFKTSNSIEVRNLTFTKYPEDACTFYGSSSSINSYKNYWVHNNYFKKGENKYDLTEEQDKGDGDGSSDFFNCTNITYSYNVFENCHKTSLHGNSDGVKQYNSTWHHNYLLNCGSRLPLTRQVNLHTYNNYYYNCETCTDTRASAWVFAESNYFENCTNAFKTTSNTTYGDPIVKLYNNVLSNSKISDKTSTVTQTNDRTLEISPSSPTNSNVNPYPNFDTDASVFYYDSQNKSTDVAYLTSAQQAKTDILQAAGLSKENAVLSVYLPDTEINTETTTETPIVSDDNERYYKTELLINEMLKEDGPSNGSLWNKESETKFKWSYINGCMASAMIMLGDIKNDESYVAFADNYMSEFISDTNNGTSGYIDSSTGFKYSSYALDDLNSGKSLIELTARGSSNGEKYTNALSSTLYTNILQYMLNNKTTSEGNLWHKNVYPYQVWLDGIYMETPFWLEYELEISKDSEAFTQAADNVTNQILNVYNKMRDPSTGLYFHGYNSQADKASSDYDASSAISWADPNTGCSSNYWLRGTGWYAMALVDNIELMQKAEKEFNIDLGTQKATLINIYTDLMSSMLKYQDKDTKLWYQVIDKPDENYNYLETSGSAAMSYALMKGYNIGIADINYYNEGLNVYRGICDLKLDYTNSDNSSVQLNDICMTAGLAGPSSGKTSSSATIGPKYTSRDGSYDYYVSEKTVVNDAKGVAPLIFAYCQILYYNNNNDTSTESTTETTTETTTFVSHVGETVVSGVENKEYKLTPSSVDKDSLTDTSGIFKLYSGKLTVKDAYIDLGGGGNFTKNSISFTTTGKAQLAIKYFGTAERTLEIKGSDSSFVSQTDTTSQGSVNAPDTFVCSLDSPDTYYIYSTNSGIKITEVILTYSDGTSILIGDVDQNGTIEKADASLLLKHISGISNISSEEQLTAADCNKDGKYNLADVTAILKFIYSN